MRRHGQVRPGTGVAWLVSDRLDEGYLCYWYGGADDAHLFERTRAASAADAIAWGRQRTPRVRIRTSEGRTYWAGPGPAPDGFVDSWRDREATTPPAPPGPTPELTTAPNVPVLAVT